MKSFKDFTYAKSCRFVGMKKYPIVTRILPMTMLDRTRTSTPTIPGAFF